MSNEAVSSNKNVDDVDSFLEEIKEVKRVEERGALVYQFKSDIEREDHKAFKYNSALFSKKWVLPMYVGMPIVCNVGLLITTPGTSPLFAMGAMIVMYVIIALFIIFRVEKTMKAMDKDTPSVLKSTPTTISFFENRIYNMKKGRTIKAPYDNVTTVTKTSKRVFIYFDNGKAMVLRRADIEEKANFDEFIKFVKTKIKETR